MNEVTPEKKELQLAPKDSVIGLAPSLDNVLLVSDLNSLNASDSLRVVRGTVTEVCQMKGCWMKLDQGQGNSIRVTFKDYALFVPKDLAGKEIVMRGIAKEETLDVETLRHYAEDAGKTKEEIESITEPKTSLSFEADGVMILPDTTKP